MTKEETSMSDKDPIGQENDIEPPHKHGIVESVGKAERQSKYEPPTVTDLPEWSAVTGILASG
jgi:hypothetical protein